MAARQKRKIQWAISLFLVMLYFSGLSAQAQYGGGSGEPNDPYLIYTAEQMNAIGADANDWDKHFKLMVDIDLSAFTGRAFNIIGYWQDWGDNKPFTGVFNGNGHTISNFSYASTDTFSIGLFGYVDDPNAEIKDLGLIDPNVHSGTGSRVGSLVGELWNGTVNGCYVKGGIVLAGTAVGGLVGTLNYGTISDCSSAGSVSGGSNFVGGLVGALNKGTITNCYSSSSVSGWSDVGGLVGYNYGTISNCYSVGSVTVSWEKVGGLVGWNEGTISNCYATGSVSGDSSVGGLVGENSSYGTITKCYATGSVSGWSVGGLVGRGSSSKVHNSFWDIETSGQTTSVGGTGKTTAEMQMASTFAGWWCEPVWTIDERKDYPRLWWENMPGQLITNLYGGGSGTQGDPYLIYTAEQLNLVGLVQCDWDKHFKLMADIDLGGFSGIAFNIIGSSRDNAFTGVFDGNGKTISNFSYISTDKDHIGLFGCVRGKNAEIKDLGLIAPNIDAGTGIGVGSLVARVEDGTITGCYAQGSSVSGNEWVGGLVGLNFGTITSCYATARVTGSGTEWWRQGAVGGLVGSNGGTITNCYSSGSVSSSSTASIEENPGGVGGMVGFNGGTIINCCSMVSVSGTNNVGEWDVGGLVGQNWGAIANCYSVGSVTGNNSVGGLVGWNIDKITNCYATGSVSGKGSVGGLVGIHVAGSVIGCFWDMQTSGQTSSNGGTGKTTAEMQKPNTFMDTGWDFAPHDIWVEPDGGGYPILWWQLSPLPELSFSGGTGEPDEPYVISTANELNSIGHNPRLMTTHFKLINDIDLTGIDLFIIGNELFPFNGVFDGNGHKISNFNYTSTDRNYIGLFGYVDDPDAQIKNLRLIDPNVDAGTGDYVGSLVGHIEDGTISNCYVQGGRVSGNEIVGGLVGHNSGKITHCYATASVMGSEKEWWRQGAVGGLVGNNGGSVSNSYSTAAVSCNTQRVGGLSGINTGSVSNSYSIGSVQGLWEVGGLVGENTGGIKNCYSVGNVTGTFDVGGLVGDNDYGAVTFSFWDIETSGQSLGLGIGSSDGISGKTTAEMQMESTFLEAGWDFVEETVNGTDDIWWILEGQDYPRLWWELLVD